MNSSWTQRTGDYLDELQQCVDTIDLILEDLNIQTVTAKDAEVSRATGELTAALKTLETKIVQRDLLVSDQQAPARGNTLTEKLRDSGQAGHTEMAIRCVELSSAISMTNQRAISLFVCLYHLADTSAEIVRLLSGTAPSPTYGNEGKPPTDSGGGLFNEAA